MCAELIVKSEMALEIFRDGIEVEASRGYEINIPSQVLILLFIAARCRLFGPSPAKCGASSSFHKNSWHYIMENSWMDVVGRMVERGACRIH